MCVSKRTKMNSYSLLVLFLCFNPAQSFFRMAPVVKAPSRLVANSRFCKLQSARASISEVEPAPASSSRENNAFESKLFNFHTQWYPIAVTEYLDPKKPHPVQLLGKDLVLWLDSRAGAWRAFEDACPHRLAPLSEGRVEPDGTLLCAYHAWRFRGDGACTAIPQSRKELEARHCDLPKACAVSHPTMERHGLLWVWGQPGGSGSDAAILSKSAQPPRPL